MEICTPAKSEFVGGIHEMMAVPSTADVVTFVISAGGVWSLVSATVVVFCLPVEKLLLVS